MKNHNILIILAVFLAAFALTASLIAFQGPTGHVSVSPGDTIILRPNANGDHIGLDPNNASNWDMVNENVSDNDSTYVHKKEKYDLYQFSNSSENLSIASVEVVMKCKNDHTSDYGDVKTIIKTHDDEYEAPDYDTVTNSYEDYSYTFPFNPHTGDFWTWDEINNIQAGPKISSHKDVRCTQVWIEVKTCAESGECVCDLTDVWNKLDELEGRLNNTEQEIEDLNDSFNYFVNWTEENLTEVWDKLDQVQTEISDMNDTLNSFMNRTWDQFDDVQGQLDDLQTQINNLQNQTWSMLIYGFHDIITSTRIETFYNPVANDPISFVVAVPPSFIPVYRIAVAGTGPAGPCYQVLKWGAFIPSNTIEDFTDEIRFGQSGFGDWGFKDTGTYDLNLIVQRLWWPLNPSSAMFSSQDFRIDVVALESFIENSTINITYPEVDAYNISWHQGGLINMSAILGENTPGEDNYCDAYYTSNLYVRGLEYTEYLARLPMYSGNSSKYCQGDILTTKMDEGNQGIYKVCVEVEFIGSYDQEDCINIGIDNLAPIIYGVWPGETDAVNGVRYFYANVRDDESAGNWSGVESVILEIINKTGDSKGNTTLIYNDSSEVWGEWIDTNTTGTPDNSYTLVIYATDAAGNTATKSVDPIIDNTAPDITSIAFSGGYPHFDSMFCRGYPVTITANITDNLAGVNDSSVYATIDSLNITLANIGDNLYSGTYMIPAGESLGSETADVYAEDLATNPASDSSSFEITYSYNVALSLSPTSQNKGEKVTASGTVAYDNGTAVDNQTLTIILPWDGSIATTVLNGTFSTKFDAPDENGKHTITASITADNNGTFTDTAILTVPKQGGGGGGGGCTTNWQLVSCTGCKPAGTKECTYEDKGTCKRGTKVTTESCTYKKPAEEVPVEIYTPSGAEVPTAAPEAQKPKPSILPYLIIGIAGLAIILAIVSYYMSRRRKKK
jgi:archaellum component FlaC